jgi:hypothetical protein
LHFSVILVTGIVAIKSGSMTRVASHRLRCINNLNVWPAILTEEYSASLREIGFVAIDLSNDGCRNKNIKSSFGRA